MDKPNTARSYSGIVFSHKKEGRFHATALLNPKNAEGKTPDTEGHCCTGASAHARKGYWLPGTGE